MAQRTVDDYIAEYPDWRGEVVAKLRALVREAAPDATEAIKWGQPVWSSNGPSIHVKAFGRSVNLGFWRGADLDDPDALLSGDGSQMKHLRIASLDDIREDAIRAFVRQAIDLNRTLGDPTKRG